MNVEDNNLVNIRLMVNGSSVAHEIPAQTTLQHFLHHDIGLCDVKLGCGEGVCGACTVLLDGEAVAACLVLVAQAQGRTVITAAGLKNTAIAAAARVSSLQGH